MAHRPFKPIALRYDTAPRANPTFPGVRSRRAQRRVALTVASVQAQGIDDIEILIVGDGVDDSVRSAVERLQAADLRIRFFDFPKAPRNGEIHRDGVLRQARGRIICYQADDDLWLPGHLQDMEDALVHADFVGAMHVNVEADGRVRGFFRHRAPRIQGPVGELAASPLRPLGKQRFWPRVRGASVGGVSSPTRRLDHHTDRIADRSIHVDDVCA